MKPILIRFTDAQGKVTQTFSAVSVKTGMFDRIFDIADQADTLKEGDVKKAREFFRDVKALIVAIFGNQFTYDELNDSVEQGELMKVFNDICSLVKSPMAKN